MARVRGFTRRTASGAPTLYVGAEVRLRRFGTAREVQFRVDTGATFTCLHPVDWVFLVPTSEWDRWRPTMSRLGIAGSRGYVDEDAEIAFLGNAGAPLLVQRRRIWIGIPLPGELTLPPPPSFSVPSLLGMDILGRCDFSYTHASAQFVLDLP